VPPRSASNIFFYDQHTRYKLNELERGGKTFKRESDSNPPGARARPIAVEMDGVLLRLAHGRPSRTYYVLIFFFFFFCFFFRLFLLSRTSGNKYLLLFLL
jgi:hypothetical protein